MTVNDFITMISQWTSTRMPKEQADLFRHKVMRFSDKQLEILAEALLEKCKNRPAMADIYEVALDKGWLRKEETRRSELETWPVTDCRYCHGEGALSVILHTEYIVTKDKSGDESGRRKEITLLRVFPQSAAAQIEFEWAEGDAQFCFRCNCDAAERRPSGWPRFHPEKFLDCTAPLVYRDRQPLQEPIKRTVVAMNDFRPMKQIIADLAKDLDDSFHGWD